MQSPMEELISHIVSRTNEVWDASKEPYFLSKITPETQAKGLNYRELIGPITLKEFVSSLSDKVTVVIHPYQRAKIGLIPNGQVFNFEQVKENSEDGSNKSIDKPARSFSPRYAVMNFLQALSKLDDKELDKVDIPISVLARMMQER